MSSIRYFRTFIAVARHGSFAAASEHVSLTPAAVGLQIQALENDLGFLLFDRMGRSIMLNRRGHALLPMAHQLIALYDRMRTQDPEQIEPVGSISVATIATAMQVVVRAVLSMRQAYPRLETKPDISYSGDLVSRVKEGEIDAAISVRGPHRLPAGVLWTPLYTEPLVFLCSKRLAGKGCMQDLLEKRVFLRVARTTTTGVLIDELIRRHHLKPVEFLEMTTMRTIADLVKDDLGVAILPIPIASNWTRDPGLHVIRFDDPKATRTVGLFENESRTFLTSILREHLLAQIRKGGFGD